MSQANEMCYITLTSTDRSGDYINGPESSLDPVTYGHLLAVVDCVQSSKPAKLTLSFEYTGGNRDEYVYLGAEHGRRYLMLLRKWTNGEEAKVFRVYFTRPAFLPRVGSHVKEDDNLTWLEDVGATFSSAIYDAGINWYWFYVTSGDILAVFRLHTEDELCWRVMIVLHGPHLFASTESSGSFCYGNREQCIEMLAVNKKEQIRGVPPEFAWLERLLSRGESEKGCRYHGVEFYR
jgi:hypothetical protein